MRLIDEILSDSNIDRAILQVKRNKGVSGVDKMTVDELDEYFISIEERLDIPYLIRNISPNQLRESISQSLTARKDH